MRLTIISNNCEHLKTEQVISKLSAKPCYEITLTTLPFIKRKQRRPLLDHRPNQMLGMSPVEISKQYDLELVHFDRASEIKLQNYDYAIITAGIILPLDTMKASQEKIINCHSGNIPTVRGQDAFKWAIYNKKLLVNTLHFIDEDVDAGRILAKSRTPVFKNDSIQALAMRHYECEIELLSNFQQHLCNPPQIKFGGEVSISAPYKRMNNATEKNLLEKFVEYRKEFGE